MKKQTAAWLGIVATWFGMHCGSGFATGTQYIIYYNKYGWMAMFLPLITWAILGVAFYFFFEYGRRTKISSYADYARKLFIPKYGWVFVLLFDLWCISAQILGNIGILAGSGSLSASYGLNYWVGVIAVALIVFGMVIFGKNILAKINSYFLYGLIIVILILSVIGLYQNWDSFKSVLANHEITEGATFGQGLKSALIYAGVQIGSIFALSGLVSDLKDEKEVRKTAILGSLVNVLMLMALGLVMIANFPWVNGETLPVYSVLEKVGFPILKHLYSLMLLMALITTGAGCTFALVNRFKVYPIKWFKWSERLSSIVVAFVALLIGAIASKVGLVAVFSTGYSFLSKMAWPLGMLPAIILIPIRLVQMKKAEKEGRSQNA